VHVHRYAAAAALADYHSGQARLVLIDLPFVGIALVVMAIVGGAMVLVPASLFFVFAALAIGRAREFRRILDARTAQDNRKYGLYRRSVDRDSHGQGYGDGAADAAAL